jgi:hypothetical protein
LMDRSPYYSHINKEDLGEIRKRIGTGASYLIPGVKGEYVPGWNLYIPKNFRDLFEGVR